MSVRDQLLDIAQDEIQRGGIDAVSFRTLAEAVGIKSASVHYHFRKKEDLIAALGERYQADFAEALEAIERRHTTARTRLSKLVDLFVDTRRGGKVCYCGMMAALSERLDDRSRDLTRQFFSHLRSWVERVLAEADDELEIDISMRALASALVASLEGALLIDHLDGSNRHLGATRELIAASLA